MMEATPAVAASLAGYSVAETTQKCYASLLKRLEKAKCAKTCDGFILFLTMPHERLCHQTVDSIFCALRYDQQRRASAVPNEKLEQVKRCIVGYKRLHPEDTADRGAIGIEDLVMLTAKLALDPSQGQNMMALIFQWGFGLRGGQMRFLQRKQFFPISGDSWLYTGPRFKVKWQNSTLQETHNLADEMKDMVTEHLAHFSPEDYLFPSHPACEISQFIKKAAIDFGWDPRLKWDGSHCLRHGSIVSARAEGGIEHAQGRSAHLSSASVKHYSTANEDRRRRGTATVARKQPKKRKPRAQKTAKKAKKQARR
jgi:hypothetical protein